MTQTDCLLTTSPRRENARSIQSARFWAVYYGLQILFVLLDHLANHFAADRTGLLGSQIAVIAFLQVDANLAGGLHLELLHGFLSVGLHILVITGHSRYLLFIEFTTIV